MPSRTPSPLPIRRSRWGESPLTDGARLGGTCEAEGLDAARDGLADALCRFLAGVGAAPAAPAG